MYPLPLLYGRLWRRAWQSSRIITANSSIRAFSQWVEAPFFIDDNRVSGLLVSSRAIRRSLADLTYHFVFIHRTLSSLPSSHVLPPCPKLNFYPSLFSLLVNSLKGKAICVSIYGHRVALNGETRKRCATVFGKNECVTDNPIDMGISYDGTIRQLC